MNILSKEMGKNEQACITLALTILYPWRPIGKEVLKHSEVKSCN